LHNYIIYIILFYSILFYSTGVVSGVVDPLVCNLGTFGPTEGLVECLPCTAGSYCDDTELTEVQGDCAAGYFCPQGSISASQRTCHVAHYCPGGTGEPIPCPSGSYQPLPGQSVCIDCPARFYCFQDNSTDITPVACPPGSYCPASSELPTVCPDGTYDSRGSLQSSSECTPCPVGRYCQQGISIGPCRAGYYCLSRASSPTPSDQLCPAGHYCLDGCTTPTPCPESTIRETDGGARLSDCLICPAGYSCFEGNPEMIACPVGYYCENEQTQVPCRMGTYNQFPGGSNSSVCLPCPGASFCSEEAISDPSTWPCFAGHYCPEGTLEPIPCPGGTYQDTPGVSVSVEDCLVCPGGFYCSNSTVFPVECPALNYCPEGSSWSASCVFFADNTNPTCIRISILLSMRLCYSCLALFRFTACPTGHYCPAQSATPILCPVEHFCPFDSSQPIYCDRGYYCPQGSSAQESCPLGYYSHDNRRSFEATCVPCTAGVYSNDTSADQCFPCSAGSLCLGRAINPTPVSIDEGGYPCPLGHYCPAGTLVALPCPTGTYAEVVGTPSQDECHPCAAGTYAANAGSVGCAACTTSSWSDVGATLCTCLGKYRTFQNSDRQCLCQSGYEFISNGVSLFEDSADDCQAIVYQRCQQGYTFDSAGNCVASDGTDCHLQCDYGGTLSVVLGLCECNRMPTLDQVCNRNCRDDAPIISYFNGSYVIDFPNHTSSRVDVVDMESLLDLSSCALESCRMFSIIADGTIGGQYGVNQALSSFMNPELLNSTVQLKQTFNSRNPAFHNDPFRRPHVRSARISVNGEQSGRKLLQSGNNNQFVVSPAIICLSLNEGIIVDVSTGHYPVYQRDNLLNTNPTFDYGPFRELASRMRSSSQNSSVTLFSYIFTTPGIYMFSDSADANRLTLFKVVRASEVCPLADRIIPLTISNMVTMGLAQDAEVLISPDWYLIIMFLFLVIGVVGILAFGGYQFQHMGWKKQELRTAKYKKLALIETLDLWNWSSKGSVVDIKNISHGIRDIGDLGLMAGPKQQYLKGAFSSDSGTSTKPSGERAVSLLSVFSGEDPSDSTLNKPAHMIGVSNSALTSRKLKGGDVNMYELQVTYDFEGFDFSALSKLMRDNKMKIIQNFDAQDRKLESFYNRVAHDSNHFKQVLAVKMQVQLNESAHGFFDAVELLVSAEYTAREAFADLFLRKVYSTC
jgi:hypothetical protein